MSDQRWGKDPTTKPAWSAATSPRRSLPQTPGLLALRRRCPPAQRRRRHPRYRREVLRQPRDRHGLAPDPNRHEPRPRRLSSRARARLRLRRWEWPLRRRMAPLYPQITRKTDKGLPRYDDATDSDVFLLSGAEDLVPALLADGTRDAYDDAAESVLRYRPRVEGGFARIERRTRKSDGIVYWTATTPANVTSIYGRSAGARIADPQHAWRVFTWLLEETRDDKGNVLQYEYKAENLVNVPRNVPSKATGTGATRRSPTRISSASATATPRREILQPRSSRCSSTTASMIPSRRPSTRRSPGPAGKIPFPPIALASRSAPTDSAGVCSCSTAWPSSGRRLASSAPRISRIPKQRP